MKIVIDVEKDYYEMLKYNVEHGQKYKPFEVIANGIPVSTEGDLINREYVENIVKSEVVDLQDGTEEWRTYVNDTCENILIKVHNAPTVPERDYSQGWHDAITKALNEAYTITSEDGSFKVVQTETLEGLGMSMPERPQGEKINEIPKDFIYDTETSEFYCYRNKYTGEEIHIVKPPKTYILARPQGEWGVHGECPFCSYIRKWKDDNFCGNCGAYLKGGAENEDNNRNQ